MNDRLDRLRAGRVGLALSGGSVRGLAHIGVIKALEEAGIRPSVVTGTSVGSLIGAAVSAGMGWRDLAEMARDIFWPSLLNGKQLERFCARYLPQSFDHLRLPFAAVATLVPSKQAVAIRTGALASAISASCALRLLRRPVERNGRRLKDGGFACVLPTHACREMGAEFVIASDVWEWSSLMRSVGCRPSEGGFSRRLFPSHYRFALKHADIHINPHIPAVGYVPGAAAVERLITEGSRATHLALAALSTAAARKPPLLE